MHHSITLAPDGTPISINIRPATPGEALVIWCALGASIDGIAAFADKHLPEDARRLVRAELAKKYVLTYAIWDHLDDTLKGAGIITSITERN